MTRISRAHVLFAALAVALCVPAAGISSGNGLPTTIGKGEGQLNLVAWEGYTQPQWVKPFTSSTGCTVHAKYAGSSDEMVTLMRTGGGGQYDMVSASGDASLRLIYGKDVQTIDPAKIPDFKNFGKAFQSPPNNTIKGKHYGSRSSGDRTRCSTTRRRSALLRRRGHRSTTRSTRARSRSRTTRSRSRMPRCT